MNRLMIIILLLLSYSVSVEAGSIWKVDYRSDCAAFVGDYKEAIDSGNIVPYMKKVDLPVVYGVRGVDYMTDDITIANKNNIGYVYPYFPAVFHDDWAKLLLNSGQTDKMNRCGGKFLN